MNDHAIHHRAEILGHLDVLERLQDPRRLEILDALGLLDSPPEESYDRFTKLARKILDVPVALVSLVTDDRQFFKSCVGLGEPWASERQTPLSHSFCQYVVASEDELVVDDARSVPMLRDNLAVRDLDVVAYLGIPLRTSGGAVLGSFCAIDSKPRPWPDEEIEVMRDLAAAAANEIELRRLSRDLQQSHLEMRRRELSQEELRQMLVHDLRNPLSSILSCLELLELSGELGASGRTSLDLAREAGVGMLGLIDDILDLDRAEAGQFEISREVLDPADIARRAARQMRSLAELSKVELAIEIEPALPAVSGDRHKLVRTLVNLLGNAIQHTPTGGRVTLRALHVGSELRFEVEDTGRGIPESAFDLIFEKFGQVEARRSRPSSTGLGLPSCKIAVAAHGGRIDVESQLGRGTRFVVHLPAGRPTPAPTT